MKNIRHIVLLLVTVLLLASCGTEEPGFTVGTSDESSVGDQVVQYNLGKEGTSIDAEPYDYMANDLTSFIQLGEYRNLEVTRESAFLTDEEFEDEIDNLLESYSYYAEETGRAVEEGDRVLVDCAGYLDGVAFEGGTATGQTVVAAANTGYIEGFAEAFIGQMPGEEFSFNVTFPESYGNVDLAGREVTFVCTVHSIQGTEEIVPELTDAFVSETFGYNNVEEFRIIYRDTVEQQKAYYVESNMYSELWTAVV
ncbi:MAG: FKBP-type peptidyl-prolyl cis-trans isomerase, partial [Eubacteriales bacterium]